MKTRIQKWGNSLGLRIPKTVAADAKVSEGTSVEINVENGRLVVAPKSKGRRTIQELVAGITPENLHSETDTGAPVGREVW